MLHAVHDLRRACQLDDKQTERYEDVKEKNELKREKKEILTATQPLLCDLPYYSIWSKVEFAFKLYYHPFLEVLND